MSTITLTAAMPLGRLLQLFRQTAGFDQTQMGQLIGVSRATVSHWERDEREPSFSQVVAWATLTGQPLESLVNAVTPAEAGVTGAARARRDSNPQPSDP